MAEMNKTEGKPAYRRVLLKLSGEALAASAEEGILSRNILLSIAENIKACMDVGVQVSVVVGAGNIWRGRMGIGMDPVHADQMGMLATAINALAIRETLEGIGVPARVMTAIPMDTVAEPYVRDRAIHHLENGEVVIFGCGIGRPYCTTDTAAMQYAAEIGADILLMAKNIDAVYTADPRKENSGAERLASITYMDMLSRGLTVIDLTAVAAGIEKDMPSLIFGLSDPKNIYRAVMGEEIGTIVRKSL